MKVLAASNFNDNGASVNLNKNNTKLYNVSTPSNSIDTFQKSHSLQKSPINFTGPFYEISRRIIDAKVEKAFNALKLVAIKLNVPPEKINACRHPDELQEVIQHHRAIAKARAEGVNVGENDSMAAIAYKSCLHESRKEAATLGIHVEEDDDVGTLGDKIMLEKLKPEARSLGIEIKDNDTYISLYRKIYNATPHPEYSGSEPEPPSVGELLDRSVLLNWTQPGEPY